MPKNKGIVATCSSCQRKYETNTAMIRAVQDGKVESLCGYCDNSHDDAGGDNEE